tara:strand:+ start:1940 stop:2554 length:615 start_codon:yes stop_codon:yes gene_type:complete
MDERTTSEEVRQFNRTLNALIDSEEKVNIEHIPPKQCMSTSSYCDGAGKAYKSGHGYKHYDKKESRLVGEYCDDAGNPIPDDGIGAAIPDLRQYRNEFKEDPALFSDEPSPLLEDTLVMSGLKNSIDFTAPSVYKEKKYAKKKATEGLLVCYVNVGQLPEYRVPAYLEEIKETWAGSLRSIPSTYKVIFLPVRHSDTRIEVVKL